MQKIVVRNSREAFIRYFIITIFIIVFVIFNVLQNVEVMKIKIENRKLLTEERQLDNKNDRIKYEIEKLRRMDLVEKFAVENGMKELSPYDFVTIQME